MSKINFPYDFVLFAHPLTLSVINYGLIFFLHFSKKTIYFFLGKGALLISYQKNTSIIILRYSFLPVAFEILDKTCINTIQLWFINYNLSLVGLWTINIHIINRTLKRSHIVPRFSSVHVNCIICTSTSEAILFSKICNSLVSLT